MVVEIELTDPHRVFFIARTPKCGGFPFVAVFGFDPNQIHVLRFGGKDTEGFRSMLLTGSQDQSMPVDPFAPCRAALAQRGYSCELPDRALVFVEPDEFTAVRHALRGVKLKPYDIVISRRFEYLLFHCSDFQK